MSTEIREEKILELLSPYASTSIKDIAKKLISMESDLSIAMRPYL